MEGFIRPDPVVLPESAVVPDQNIIAPSPNQFTHELIRPEPFYFEGPQHGRPPDGEFPAGHRVVLLFHDGGPFCRVADGRGLYVGLRCDALKRVTAEGGTSA